MLRDEVLELLSSSDPTDLAEAARAIGRDLAHHRTAEVDEVRRHLERPSGDAFAQGFALAVEHIASSFAVAGAEADDLAQYLAARSWNQALVLYVLKTRSKRTRVGLTATKKIGHAVQRNRADQ